MLQPMTILKRKCRIQACGADILAKMSATDLELLQQYTRLKSEQAFAELVRRHIGLVYSAALRQVRSPQLAEEVAQSAFADLARSADTLKADSIVSAWLYQVTRRTAIDVVRRETRRQLREQIATEMNAMNATASDWTQIEPLLDEAVSALDDTDRAAVLLRYFENKSLREVGAALGTSDDAAQKRVSRAVERLREFFAKRGVTIGASGLVVVISANAVQAAPVGLAITISTAAALAKITLVTTTTHATMNWITVKTVGAIVAAAIVTATGTHLMKQREVTRLREESRNLVAEKEQLTSERDAILTTVAANKDEIERLQTNQTELLRLRGEIGVMRRQLESQNAQAKPQPAMQREPTSTTGHPPGAYISKDRLAFAGYATPEAALETITWTMMNGTYDQANEGLSPAMLAQEETNDTRSREQRLEQFEASRKRMAPFFKGIQIVARKSLANDKVELKVKMDSEPIPGQQHDLPPFMIQPMVKVGDTWRIGGSTRGHEETWDNDAQIQTFVP